MAKTKRSPEQLKIEEFAKRRAGATYIDASIAAKQRLLKLREEYGNVPPSYRGYLAVGICSCLESHIKYSYASAAERFVEHPDLLKLLYKDISVDIGTLISTASRTFHLADVIAANIKISSLDAYRNRASYFFTVFTGKHHDFPWDFARLITDGDPEMDKIIALQLDRLDRVFVARHNFVHETDILAESSQTKEIDDPIECLDDALWLISQFHKQFEHLEMSPKYSTVKDDEGLADAVARNLAEIDEHFERIKIGCEARQYEKLDKFKNAFVESLWARCDFQASVFIAQQSEASMSFFLDLAPEYRETLKELGPRQKYMLSQYPLSRQYADMGLEPDGTLTREFNYPDKC
jgi:hypothetical protein